MYLVIYNNGALRKSDEITNKISKDMEHNAARVVSFDEGDIDVFNNEQ